MSFDSDIVWPIHTCTSFIHKIQFIIIKTIKFIRLNQDAIFIILTLYDGLYN